MSSKKRQTAGLQVGGASILTACVLLALAVFSVLSLTSAAADYRLSERMGELTAAYYAADSEAERIYADIDMYMPQLPAEGFISGAESYLAQRDGLSHELREGALLVSYSVPVADSHELRVRLRIDPATRRAAVDAWQLVSTYDWVEDDSLELWRENMPL